MLLFPSVLALSLLIVSAAGPYSPSSLFTSTNCDRLFDWAEQVWRFPLRNNIMDQATFFPDQSFAALCPSDCLQQLSQDRHAGLPKLYGVFGSFPYFSSSSICLAAVHAGIINDTLGGGVFVNRFYRHDWSNTSTQTIFPHESWRGSLSNGI